MKDEWVISRVFQKNISSNAGSATISSSGNGGSKKTRIISSSSTMSLYPEPSSPSSVYLPPLLDSSPAYSAVAAATTSTAASAAVNDRDSCSNAYDSNPLREHVSCFSTISGTPTTHNYNFTPGGFDFSAASTPVTVDPFTRFQRNGGVSAFPSLRSLQDNLQLPFFFPAPQQPFHGVPVDINSWAAPAEETRVADGGPSIPALGGSDLDCMWGF